MRKTHGHASGGVSRTYCAWRNMKNRCLDPKNKRYDRYGGRGIGVCKEWAESFEAFLNDMGEAPEGMQIDRIDNDGDYCKENCRWADRFGQMRNTERTVLITVDGQTKCMKDWAETVGITPAAFRQRVLRLGAEAAVKEGPRTRKSGRRKLA